MYRVNTTTLCEMISHGPSHDIMFVLYLSAAFQNLPSTVTGDVSHAY